MSTVVPSLLAQWYDSTRQRGLMLPADGASGALSVQAGALDSAVLGRLRWDAIRSWRRMQTHTQLLDGVVFHCLADERAIEKLGVFVERARVFPFRVTVVGGSLEASLRDMVSRGFLFSSIADGYWQRHALLNALEEKATPETVERFCQRDGVVDGLVGLIGDTGVVQPEECRRLRQVWRFWVDAEATGRLSTYEAQPYGDDASAFQLEDFENIELRTPAGRAIRRRIPSLETKDPRSGVRRRSLVWKLLEPLDRSGDPDEHADAATLRQAFDRCYYRNIAMREGVMLSSEDGERLRGVRRRAALRYADTSRMAVFPHGYRLRLGELSAREWTDLVDAVQGELHSWWFEWNVSAIQEIGNRLDAMATTRSRSAARPSAVTAFITAAGGGVSALATSTPTGLAIGAGVGVATWIVEGTVRERLSEWKRRRASRYDVIELLPAEPDRSAASSAS